MKNAISVVIPSYNHEKYIYDSVMSVVNQSVPPAEIVIVDDGSTDKTVDICKKISAQYPIVRIFEQENQGAHNALNRGIEMAQGEYIAILNSDDLFLLHKIKTCIQLIEDNPRIEFFVHSVDFIDENSRKLSRGIVIDWYNRALGFYRKSQLLGLSLLNENFVVTTSNMFFLKKFWEQATGFQPLRYCHDLEFLLAASRNVGKFVVQQQSLTQYRVHPTNTIKENIRRVRVEIAAVIAQAIIEGKRNLLDIEAPESLVLFRKFLRNKNLSDLVLFFIMQYLQSENKTTFYNNILPDRVKDNCAQLLD